MSWNMFFLIYCVVGAACAIALTFVANKACHEHEDGDGHEIVLTAIFWLPALALVLLTWGWMTLDEMLSPKEGE